MSLQIDNQKLESICRKWHIDRLSIFGSALREDFTAESDVDVIVRFEPNATPTLFDLSRIASELETLFGRNVDLVTEQGVQSGSNPRRRQEILESAEPVYVR